MCVTFHCLQRYSERILKLDLVNGELKKYINENKNKLVNDILELKQNSRLIYSGQINEHTESNFYLNKNIIIVEDVQNKNLKTLFDLSFGFDEDIDADIAKKLISKLENINKKIDKTKEKINKDLSKKQVEIETVDNEIKFLQQQLELLQKKRDKLNVDVEVINNEVTMLKIEKDKIAHRLISANYKLEQLNDKKKEN